MNQHACGGQSAPRFEVRHGDCLDVLRTLADASVDSVVTDPPYGLSFMGKKWDYDVPSVDVWAECLRVLKPGGHLLAFAGTRTQHRMAVRIEDAGFEIRDMIAWVYGSGFPKSHNLDGERKGWGTALKPALEPITVARKPLVGTVAANVMQHGTGAINVDGCRVGSERPLMTTVSVGAEREFLPARGMSMVGMQEGGRWPANLIHDGSEEVTDLFPFSKSGSLTANQQQNGGFHGTVSAYGSAKRGGIGEYRANEGSAARFFYCAKASKSDREDGCDDVQSIHRANGNKWTDQDYRVSRGERPQSAESGPRKNAHPTVKPTELMRYLCRLVTPPNGLVLDPFTGSGSTGRGAVLEGFRFLGIEREAEYVEIARRRIAAASSVTVERDLFS